MADLIQPSPAAEMRTDDMQPDSQVIDEASEAPAPGTSVRADAATAVRWSMIGLAGRQIIRFGFMLILARLLGPENFGIVAQASVVIAFMAVFLDQGLGAALIQKPRLTDRDVGTVFLMNVATAVLLGGLTFASAPLVADFFGTPALTDVVRALSISVVVLALAVTPLALLAKRLRFRAIALAELAGASLGGVAGLAAVLMGAGYWALVVQTVVSDVALLLGFAAATGRIPVRGSVQRLGALWSVGSRVMGFQVLNYFNRNIDNLLIGRYLGPTQLGLYALSYRIMLLPVQGLGEVGGRVAFPMYARLQDDPDRIGRQFIVGARLIALAAFPLMGLVIVGAPLGVPMVFGESWSGAVVPMQILAVTGMAQSVGMTVNGVLVACGRTDWLLRWGIGSTLLIVSSIALGLQWGVVGVAAGYTTVSLLLLPGGIYLVARLGRFRMGAFARAMLPVSAATGALVVAGVAATAVAQAATWPDLVALAAAIAAALGTYALVLRACWPEELVEARGFIGLMRQGGSR